MALLREGQSVCVEISCLNSRICDYQKNMSLVVEPRGCNCFIKDGLIEIANEGRMT